MKTIYNVYEGLLKGQKSTLDNGEEAIFEVIEEFLKENYNGKWIISKKPNKDGLYEVSSNENIKVKNTNITSLTNGLFIWTSVKGNFNCSGCKSLKTLEGAPEEVEGDFSCYDCNLLKTLEGSPKEVGGYFSCYDCNLLKTLKGAPEDVEGGFYCSYCEELKSLKGAPEYVGGNFSCHSCNLLKTLDGAPEEVGGDFSCFNCGKVFSEDDIKKVSNINGNIYC